MMEFVHAEERLACQAAKGGGEQQHSSSREQRAAERDRKKKAMALEKKLREKERSHYFRSTGRGSKADNCDNPTDNNGRSGSNSKEVKASETDKLNDWKREEKQREQRFGPVYPPLHPSSIPSRPSLPFLCSMATLLKPTALSTESPPFNPRAAGSISSNGVPGTMGGGGSESTGVQPDNSNSNAIAKHTFPYNGYVFVVYVKTVQRQSQP